MVDFISMEELDVSISEMMKLLNKFCRECNWEEEYYWNDESFLNVLKELYSKDEIISKLYYYRKDLDERIAFICEGELGSYSIDEFIEYFNIVVVENKEFFEDYL